MADQAARDGALDTTRSILLQAPAGSGKTTVLAQRFLCALAVVDEPEEVLAITFTRKAAAEMRERVLLALEDGLPATLPDLARWRALRAGVLAQAARCGWNTEELPQRLRIQTIDSLAHEIARAMPLLGRMQASLHVVDDAAALHAEAARETLRYGEHDAQFRSDTDLLLQRLDNNWDQAATLLAGLLPGRGRWLPLLLEHAPEELGMQVEASLQRIVGGALGELHARLPAALRDEAAWIARQTAHNREQAGQQGEGAWRAWLAADAALVPAAGELACWQAVAGLVLKDDGEPRALVNVNHGFPREDRALKERWRGWREAVENLPGALEGLREVQLLPPPALDAAEHAALTALARVMLLAAQHLKLVFRERGLVDHAEVAAIARQALRAGDGTDELALRQTLRVAHLLVDEFQDTSPDQIELVQALIDGWQPGDQRSLFLVGDPMQSIYLFRDSEVGLFLQIRERGVGRLRLDALQLRRNFRSQPELVAWSNNVFPSVFPRVENLRSSAVTFLASEPARAPDARLPPQVHVLPQSSDDADVEAADIAARICALRARQPDCSVAVLVQTRAVAGPVLRALRAASVPVLGVDLAALGERPAVRDLVALGQALLDAGDRSAWLAVLRSPPAGLLLADLLQLGELAGAQPLVEWLADESVLERVSGDGAARLQRVAPVLVRAWRTRGSMDFATALENTWFALGGEQGCENAAELGAARQFLLAVRRLQEQLGRIEPAQLTDLAGRLRDRGEADGAQPVEVLTIHHAKGLEWDVVFVPGLGRAARADQPPLLRWLQLPAAGGASDLLLAVRSIGESAASDPLARYIARLQTGRQQNERLRLLYVAVTRARLQLYLSGHAPRRAADDTVQPPARSLLRLLWPAVHGAFDAAVPSSESVAEAQALPQRMQFRRVPARHAMAREVLPALQSLSRAQAEGGAPPAVEFSWVGPLARAAGTAMHNELERLARLGAGAVQQLGARTAACAARLQEQGIAPAEAGRTAARIIARLAALVGEPRARWLLFTAHREAASELRLSGIVAGELRNVVIDRCFVDADGMRWIVDYKTGVHAGGGLEEFVAREMTRYAAQLRLYRELARRLGPEPVRVALYFPWLDEFRELTD